MLRLESERDDLVRSSGTTGCPLPASLFTDYPQTRNSQTYAAAVLKQKAKRLSLRVLAAAQL